MYTVRAQRIMAFVHGQRLWRFTQQGQFGVYVRGHGHSPVLSYTLTCQLPCCAAGDSYRMWACVHSLCGEGNGVKTGVLAEMVAAIRAPWASVGTDTGQDGGPGTNLTRWHWSEGSARMHGGARGRVAQCRRSRPPRVSYTVDSSTCPLLKIWSLAYIVWLLISRSLN